MAKFKFGVDHLDLSQDPDDEELQGTAMLPKEDKTPRPNGKGVIVTVFGTEINGLSEVEIRRIHREAHDRLNEMNRQDWRDLAKTCARLAGISDSRRRAWTARTLFLGMHDSDPEDLTHYAEATDNSVIDAADELSAVGGFEEKPYGIITGEIHFDESDIPEEFTGDDDEPHWDDLEIGPVEA